MYGADSRLSLRCDREKWRSGATAVVAAVNKVRGTYETRLEVVRAGRFVLSMTARIHWTVSTVRL